MRRRCHQRLDAHCDQIREQIIERQLKFASMDSLRSQLQKQLDQLNEQSIQQVVQQYPAISAQIDSFNELRQHLMATQNPRIHLCTHSDVSSLGSESRFLFSLFPFSLSR